MPTCGLTGWVGKITGESILQEEGSATLQDLAHGEHSVIKHKLPDALPAALRK